MATLLPPSCPPARRTHQQRVNRTSPVRSTVVYPKLTRTQLAQSPGYACPGSVICAGLVFRRLGD
eukprot:10301165-Karenia_brevis.AAC.1